MALDLDGDFEPGSVEGRVAAAMVAAEDFARLLFEAPEEHRQQVLDCLRESLHYFEEKAVQPSPAAA